MPPKLEMLKQPPCRSLLCNFWARARSPSSPNSFASSSKPLCSTSLITGTTNPSGVSTATPIFRYFFKTKFSLSAANDELKLGCSRIATADAFSKNARAVTLTFCFAASSLSDLRNCSSSVISASS